MRIRSKQRTKHSKTTPTEPRVFVGLFEIAGYYGRIVDHLRETGYPISFIEVTPHRFDYNSEKPRSEYKYQDFLKTTAGKRKSLFSKIQFCIVGFHLFVWAIRNHDVFVFVAGKSFSKYNLDLAVLRVLGKRVVSAVWHGSEARPAYIDGAHWELASKTTDPIKHTYKTARSQRKHMGRLQLFSSDLIAHPLSSQFLTRNVICSSFIGIPPPPSNFKLGDKPVISYPLRVVHIPSNRSVKGSDLIKEKVDRISNDHPDLIEYHEISEVSNLEVLVAMQNSDLLIDQLYSDTIWPGIGVESAANGLPIIVGNAGVDHLMKIIPSSSIPPAFVTTPESFDMVLRDLIHDVKKIQQMQSRAFSFVQSAWSLESVSKRFMQVAVNDYPSAWTFAPNSISYVYGGGISQNQVKEILIAGCTRYGLKFLSISKRKDLACEYISTFLRDTETN